MMLLVLRQHNIATGMNSTAHYHYTDTLVSSALLNLDLVFSTKPSRFRPTDSSDVQI
jgi:hypothetical protein